MPRPAVRPRAPAAGRRPADAARRGVAVLVIGCGGFLAYRAIAAIARRLPLDRRGRGRDRGARLRRSRSARATCATSSACARARRGWAACTPIWSASSVLAPTPTRPRRRATRARRDRAELVYPARRRARPRRRRAARSRFTLDERAEALAAGRREVLLAGVGAALLLIIGIGALDPAAARAARRAARPDRALPWPPASPPSRSAGAAATRSACWPARSTRSAARCRRCARGSTGSRCEDPLTGVLNHRGLHDALHETLERARDRREKVAVVVLDIDHFEELNDTAGHAAGDEALRDRRTRAPGRAAPRRRLRADRRRRVPVRAAGLRRLGRRARRRAAAQRGRRRAAHGTAARPPSAPASPSSRATRATRSGLMRLADGALYRAKRSGRNRCVVYSSFVDAPLSLQEEAERARSAGLANTVYALARAVDLKDGYTHQHSARVAQYAAVLGREMGMSEEEIDQLRTAGILHDVGKVGVADAVLLEARAAHRRRVPRDAAPLHARPRHHPGRRPARDRRVGALPARALGRPRLPGQARGRGHPARQPRARRRRRVRGDDLVAPVPARHGGREGARRAREVRRRAVRPGRRPADGRARALRRDPARRDRRPGRHPLRLGGELRVRRAARGGGRAGAQRGPGGGRRAAPSAPARGKASSARANSAS